MGMFTVAEDSETGRPIVTRWDASSEVQIITQVTSEPTTNRAPLDEYLRAIEQTLEREAAEVNRIEEERRNQPLVDVPAEYARVQRSAESDFSPSFAFIAGGVRWMEADAGQPISFLVNPANSPIAGGGTAELARAMAAWPGQSGARISLQNAGQTSRCGVVQDGSNTISYADCLSQLDPPFGGCAGVVAQTGVRYTFESRVIEGRSFNRLIEADIIFNRGMDCFLRTSANLAEVACHELGHAIGLDHSTFFEALMYPTSHGGGFDARLGADDRAGVLAAYPSGSNPPPPGGGPNASAFVSQSAPSSMTTGQTYSVSVTMRNLGTATWQPGAGYRLGSQNPADNQTWGLSRVNLPGPVSPAAEVTFTFNVRAPSTGGDYNFQWQMVQEGAGFFGPLSPNITVSVVGGGGGGGPVSITSVPMPEGRVARSYKQQLSATGGTPPYRWFLVSGSLPPGLILSQSGLIEGIPAVRGTFDFTVQVFDSTLRFDRTDSLRLGIVVNDAGGGPGAIPTVTRVKVKKQGRKLFVWGDHFNEGTLVQLNGVVIVPKSLTLEGVSGKLTCKGSLPLFSTGNNSIRVINSSGTSSIFFF
jgi:hypothetical protein